MLEHTWQQYRSWAARARQLQSKTRQAALWAMVLAILAAILGAAATMTFQAAGPGQMMTFAAAAAAATVPIVGREILSIGSEGAWIRARATAEALKSECFRYSAGLNVYAMGGVDADRHLDAQLDAITRPAKDAGMIPLDSPEDYTGPPVPMDTAWYIKNRVEEQRAHYSSAQARNERAVYRDRAIGLSFAILAAVLGVASTIFDLPSLAPWISACMTVAAAVAAFALRDRKQFLAASYGSMVQQLDRAKAANASNILDDTMLVAACEDLMSAESKVWTNRVAEMPFVPPAAVAAPRAGAESEDGKTGL